MKCWEVCSIQKDNKKGYGTSGIYPVEDFSSENEELEVIIGDLSSHDSKHRLALEFPVQERRIFAF